MKQMIYSTLYLTDGAAGSQSLFTVPQGQPIAALRGPSQRCANCGCYPTPPTQTNEHTNISRAGQVDAAIGSVILHSIQAKTDNKSRPDATITLRISGKNIGSWHTRELFDGPITLPDLLAHRTDAFEAVFAVAPDTQLKLTEPTLFRLEFWTSTEKERRAE